MPGFKNVLFGGEGLFVTTLTGPGTVWLQGMPPDRMISEIARRVPSGGIGLGIPIGMGGSSDKGEDGEGVGEGETETGLTEESSDGDNIDGGEDLVASTDAAIEADRNATVASSGLGQEISDSESSSALFGDAAPPSTQSETNVSQQVEYDFYDQKENDTFPGGDNEGIPDLDDSTSFSVDDTDFGDDLTKNQQFDDFQEDETSFSTDSGASDDSSSDDGNSFLSMLWDFMTNDDE